ncbi:MAG: endonuclease/exonuclease/phosphatase family protein [Promethearchaeota archaeon]
MFFFQLITDLIESIYMLDLLQLEMDEKVLGLFFLCSPLALLAFKNQGIGRSVEISATIVIAARLIDPLVRTPIKIIVSGIGVASFMIFLPLYISTEKEREEEKISKFMGLGLIFATLLSITFRSLNSTLDLSMYKSFQVIGWILAILALFTLFNRVKTSNLAENNKSIKQEKNTNTPHELEHAMDTSNHIYLMILGLFGVLIFIYFALLSPTVISRWTEGNYILITISLSIILSLIGLVMTIKPRFFQSLSLKIIVTWNLLFVACVFFTIFAQIVFFPSTPTSGPVLVDHPPALYTYIPLIGMIALTPILYVDFTFVSRMLLKKKPSLSKLSKGFTLGGILFIMLSLALIFTNIWGYVEPVSPYFRNLFWLPFVLAGLFFTLPFLTIKNRVINGIKKFKSFDQKPLISAIFVILMLLTGLGVILTNPVPNTSANDKVVSLRILTYNIQQGVNITGDKNYDNQLELIKQVNPDIIGLQECDSARISGGNSDVVRYFVNRLTGMNYYSFYGPKTVTGTYGAAVLSKYPIISAKTIFTYSDEDEIGTTYVQIMIGNEIFNVFVNHPAGSKEAKLAHVEALLAQIDGKENVISMGDFNSREGSIYYEMQASVLKDVWRARWPSGIDDNGLDMRRRIDHIFVSNEFIVVEARFIMDPQSDHPALWAEIKI